MKTIIKLLLLFIPLISFSQDYIFKGDTILFLKDGKYEDKSEWLSIGSYLSVDTIDLKELSEEEKIQQSINASADIIFLMNKYYEECEKDTFLSFFYCREKCFSDLWYIEQNYTVYKKEILPDGIKITYNLNRPTFEGFIEWLNTKQK